MTDDHRHAHKQDPQQELPTTDKPLNGPRKPAFRPLLVTLAVLGLVALIYFVGLRLLVPAG